MYKMIKVFNIKGDGNEVKSAEYSVVYEFEQFELNSKTEAMLLNYCKENNLQYGEYVVVEYEDEKPISVIGRVYYDSDEEESFMDWADWNRRVIASIALGYDLVFSEETKKHFAEVNSGN